MALKERVYPLVDKEIKEKGKKAEEEFFKNLFDWFKAEELYVRSAIMIASICHIFLGREQNKQRWIDVFNKNNTFYFNKTKEEFSKAYYSLQAQFVVYHRLSNGYKNLYQECYTHNIPIKFNKGLILDAFEEAIIIRRDAYKKYRELGLQIYLDYID